VITKDSDPYPFSRKDKGYLYDPSIVPGNTISQVRDVLYLKNELVMIGIRLV
jgi:hypothetical protein